MSTAEETGPKPKPNPDVISTILKEMNKHGVDMDLKKKNKYGDYEAAQPSDMNMLKAQAKLANTGSRRTIAVCKQHS